MSEFPSCCSVHCRYVSVCVLNAYRGVLERGTEQKEPFLACLQKYKLYYIAVLLFFPSVSPAKTTEQLNSTQCLMLFSELNFDWAFLVATTTPLSAPKSWKTFFKELFFVNMFCFRPMSYEWGMGIEIWKSCFFDQCASLNISLFSRQTIFSWRCYIGCGVLHNTYIPRVCIYCCVFFLHFCILDLHCMVTFLKITVDVMK